jgi:PQQ-dependent dehydrogenase (methanol/ethanol family)
MNGEHQRRRWLGLGALTALAALAALSVALPGSARSAGQAGAHVDSLTAFPGASWPGTGGDLANSRYSTLTQITRGNVKRLKRVWSTPIDPGQQTGAVESPPIVSGGSMYASSSRGAPAALDAATGQLKWVTNPAAINLGPSRGLTSTGNGRGEAIGDGMIFEGQGDGTITAFNADTGQVVWKTLINTGNVQTYSPATPVYFNHIVYTSLSGNEFGQLRGAIYAYDAKTGSLLWTWYAVPFAGQPGSKTWGTPTELAGGGGGNWTYGAIDPKLGLLYEATGNPSPDFGRTKGIDLYTDSMVALNLKTGKMKWYFQTTHHDEWDYDCASPPILWDNVIKGKLVHGIEVACKSGYVYELNRATGKPATPVIEKAPPNTRTVGAATLKADSTWAKTQPIPVGDPVVPHCATRANVPGTAPDGKPYEYSCTFAYVGGDHYTVLTPGINGAINYEPSSYNAKLGHVYVCSAVNYQPTKAVPGAPSPLGAIAPTFANEVFPPAGYIPTAAPGKTLHVLEGTLTALNLSNNRRVWQKQYFSDTGGVCKSGSSTTVTGLVFIAEGNVFYAYDAATGAKLWSYTPPEGAVVNTPPVIYSANGKEYVAWNADLGTTNGAAGGQDEVIAFSLS